MAGTGLIGIKRRIKSVNNTKKITKAVGLVATSKLRKSRELLDVNNDYYNQARSIVKEVLRESELPKNIYIDGNGSDKKLYIAITSDSGLCGGYNSRVVNKTLEYITLDGEKASLIVVGQKGRVYFRRYKLKPIAEYVEISHVPTIKEVDIILHKAIDLFVKEEVGEINVVYTEFVSAVKQEVKVKKLIPFDVDDIEGKNNQVGITEYEPKIYKALDYICMFYLKNTLLNFMMNSKASENGSRMTAMEGATKNADDLLEKLKLKYNRIRQSAITQEISEIVGGAEAQR